MPRTRSKMHTRPIIGLVLALLTIINSLALSGYTASRGAGSSTPQTLHTELADRPNREAGAKTAGSLNHQPDKANRKRINVALHKLPLSFEVNRGQTADEVKFLSRGKGYSLYLTPTEALISLRPRSESNKLKKLKEEFKRREAAQHGVQPGNDEGEAQKEEEESGPGALIRMKIVGANPQAQIEGLEELPGKINYFIGGDSKKWRTDIPTFARVKYTDVYPGVDMVYYGNQRQLEYDFIVAPGTDPHTIALSFEGADKVEVDDAGDLVLHAASKQMRQKRPVIYQDTDGARQSIEGEYVLRGEREVGFRLGAYDSSRPLIIDPVLVYSTYFGGVGGEYGTDIAADAAGNAYITGYGIDVPTMNPYQAQNKGIRDAFVSKLNAAGTALVYSTFLGGSDSDEGYAIDIDSAGNAYVAGLTGSGTSTKEPTPETEDQYFPTTVGAFRRFPVWTEGCSLCPPYNGFTTKLNPTGNALVYSSYHGTYDSYFITDIAVNDAGVAAFTGWSVLTTGLGNSVRVVISKFKADGSGYVFGTLDGANGKYGSGVAMDTQGNVYVTGDDGYNGNFEPTPGAYQQTFESYEAFVTKLSATGTPVYRTYLGGPGADGGAAITVDTQGNAYITGNAGPGFPILNAVQGTHAGGGNSITGGDAFVTKLNAAGTALVYSTFLGGKPANTTTSIYNDGVDAGQGIALDTAGNVYVTGATASNNFPTTADAAQKTYSVGSCGTATSPYPCSDAFVTKLSATGTSILYSSYLGGSKADEGRNIAVDPNNNFYVIGFTESTNFLTKTPLQGTNEGGAEAFITKIGTAGPPPVTYQIGGKVSVGVNALATVTMTLNNGATVQTAADGTYKFTNLTAGGNYTVTPSKLGYTFTPANKAFTNLAANQTVNFAATAVNFDIEGIIGGGAAGLTDGVTAGLSGVTVKLTGSQTKTATTDVNGKYKFAALPAGGNYTVTPTKTGYSFTPASRTFTNLSGNQTTAGFTSAAIYSIGGKVTLGASATAVAGVTVTLTGARTGTTTTDNLGNYKFLNLPAGGNYTVKPTKAGYTFNPVSKPFTALNANQTAANFAATRLTYTISGKVTKAGANLGGVTVKLTGTSTATTTTNNLGAYSFTGLVGGGNFTVTPSLVNHNFTPASKSFTALGANQTTANFAATLKTYTIGGKVNVGGTGVQGVTVTLSGSKAATTTTDNLGNYKFLNLPAGGNFTVKPTKANYIFTPATKSFTALSADQTFNFAATVKTYSIKGKITVGATTTTLAGVSVKLTGGTGFTPRTVTTLGDGLYSFTGVPGSGNYTVMPSKVGYAFTPVSKAVANLSADQLAVNFGGALANFKIEGKAMVGTNALQGVTVTLSGSQAGTATTDSLGKYSFANLPAGGNYTVTPSKTNYAFTPASRAFSNLSANQLTADFSAASNLPFSVTASPSTVIVGALNSITANWSASTARPTSDWVALYKVGTASNSSYISYKYIGGGTSGTLLFDAPSDAGQYELRYLFSDYTSHATSNIITVNNPTVTLTASPATVTAGSTITVNWTAGSTRPTTDWVGLYKVGETGWSYLDYKYIGGGTSGSVSFTAPTTAGQYEFHYYVTSSPTTSVKKSNVVTVSP